jgi:hypothetical protein
MKKLLLAGIAALSVLYASTVLTSAKDARVVVIPDGKDGLVAVLQDMDGKPIVQVYFSENTSQEVLRHDCSDVPADTVIVACATLHMPGPRCYILFAPDEVVEQNSKLTRMDLITQKMGDCIRMVEEAAAEGGLE